MYKCDAFYYCPILRASYSDNKEHYVSSQTQNRDQFGLGLDDYSDDDFFNAANNNADDPDKKDFEIKSNKSDKKHDPFFESKNLLGFIDSSS